MNELNTLIQELKKYDNKDGYKLQYKTIKERFNPIIKKLIEIGEPALDLLHELIKNEETWSCLFALEILKEIKSEKSIPFLIEYIVLNEDGDYWEGCEEAMYGLNNIGRPAIKPLILELKKHFDNKKYLMYLVSSLTETADDEAYDFMLHYTNQYLENTSEYKEWFPIDHFTHDFSKQGKNEVLPILKEIQEMDHLSEHAHIELRDTIWQLEDPEGFEDEMDRIIDNSEKRYDEKRKLGRNEPCWCGSEKKYKKCCLGKDLKEKGKPRKVYIIGGKEYIGNLDEFEEDESER